MKNNKHELNVDFIGTQEPLTGQQEKILSDYFSKIKNKRRVHARPVKINKITRGPEKFVLTAD